MTCRKKKAALWCYHIKHDEACIGLLSAMPSLDHSPCAAISNDSLFFRERAGALISLKRKQYDYYKS
jgi:hypothetical protein